MTGIRTNLKSWIAQSSLAQYGGAALSVWLALSFWTFSPVLHRHLFPLLLAAVLLTARFLGFGPAIFCSLLSTVCLDFFAIVPYFSFGIGGRYDVERLVSFFVISVFAASMARQKSLAELRADRTMREMAAIVEYSCDGIYSSSPNGIITSWNRAAEQLYGYTAEEAVGMSTEQLAPPELRHEVWSNRQILNQGGHVIAYRTDRMRKDGTRWPALLSTSPLKNARGEVIGASTIARDLSAEKQSEEAIRRSEKLATAGRLAASIAHEINNPLEAVVNLLYLARRDPARAQEYLNQAEQEVGRVAQLAQQTLGFVRDTNSPTAMDPAVIMDEILQLYSRKLEGKSIRVTRSYRGHAKVNGFSGELRQLLSNLLVNAVDAMPRGGSLKVRVKTGRNLADGRDGVRITVADNGAGIPPDNLRHVFEPFYTTKKDTGTGLGLWVSQGIVQKHGGSIRVKSRADGNITGTVFSIFLPQRLEISRVA